MSPPADGRKRCLRPEAAQGLDASLHRVARHQRAVYRSDGAANDPIGLDAGSMQALVRTCLKGAERVPARQNKRNASRRGEGLSHALLFSHQKEHSLTGPSDLHLHQSHFDA